MEYIDIAFKEIGRDRMMCVYSEADPTHIYISLNYGYPKDFENINLICAAISHEILHLELETNFGYWGASHALDDFTIVTNITYLGIGRPLLRKSKKPRV